MLKYIKAARPQTLIASFGPILIAGVLAFKDNGNVDKVILIICFLIASCLQISTNFFNDYYDWLSGADKRRVGPIRFSHDDTTRVKLHNLAVSLLVVAFLLMIPMFKIHWLYFPLGILSLYFCYGYTAGVYPLAYNRLGEVFVFLFFGLVIFLGSYFALVQKLTKESFFISLCFGIANTIIISLNNWRDYEEDIVVNKKTIAGLIGTQKFKLYLYLIIILQFCTEAFLINNGYILSFSALYKIYFIYKLIRVSDIPKYRARIFPLGIIHCMFTIAALFVSLLVWELS